MQNKISLQLKTRWTKALLLFLLCCITSAAQAGGGEKIINVYGLTKTKESVIRTELQLYPDMTEEQIKQQLLQTGLFSDVNVTRTDEKTLNINVQEKWTTIPILKFNSGGGAKQTILGVYDPNIAGQRLELGFQYESLEGAPSQVVWFKDPRLFESRYFIDLQYWDTKRIRLKYEPAANEPLLTKALLLKTQRAYLALGYELSKDLKVRLTAERLDDRFSTELVSQSFLDKVPGQTIPTDVKSTQVGLGVDWGFLKTERAIQIGTLASAQYKYGLIDRDAGTNFSWLRAELLHYQWLAEHLLFAQRLQFGWTDTNTLQYWNYLGGLESIRGFVDNRFATRGYWLSNSELRHMTVEKPYYTVQAVSFVDLLGIDEGSRSIQNITAASAGLGVRLIFPKIYRLTLRLDYSRPVINSDEQFINFGIQQFF